MHNIILLWNMSFVLDIMRISSPLPLTPARALVLTGAAAIVVILFTANVTISNAQQPQQQQQPSNQTAANQNQTSLFQSTEDSFRVQVPDGWVIRDMDNTGFSLMTEALQGYGILAQICPEEEQQAALRNVGSSNNTLNRNSSCQASQEGGRDIIHIIRYPNIGSRLGFTTEDIIVNSNNTLDNILVYQAQKLQEVGYRNIQIVNSTYTTVSVDISKAAAALNNDKNDKNDKNDNNDINNTLSKVISEARVPAKLVEITYTTDLAPDEMKRGYFILTVTNATPRNLGMITGYSIFYEGNSTAAAAVTTASAETTTTPPSGSLPPPSVTPLPTAVSQVFGSFELIAGEEAIQEILAALTAQAEQGQQLGQVEQQGQSANPLTGELSSNSTEGVAPATFEFEANIEGGTEPYTINWDFDDGSEESEGESVVHTFDEAGTYTVTAFIEDNAGQNASGSLEITVEEPSPAEEIEESACDPSNPGLCLPAQDLDASDNNSGSGSSADLFDLPDLGSGSDNNSGSIERRPEIRLP
jgi:PKD repeat protein